MFGVIVAGQPLNSNFSDMSNGQGTRFMAQIGNIKSSNHIVVFLAQPIVNVSMGAGVFLSVSSTDGGTEPAWQYLGFLSNEKPSAVFKVSDAARNRGQSDITPIFNSAAGNGSLVPVASSPNSSESSALLGISMEPLQELVQNTATGEVSKLSTFADFAQHTLSNLSNYVSSFAVQVPGSSETVIPLRVFNQWCEKFQRQMQQDPYFWRK